MIEIFILIVFGTLLFLIIIGYIIYLDYTSISPTPVKLQDYGRTGPWIAKYYNFPPVNENENPIIAIISVGGSYAYQDLVYYWTEVCGLNTYPKVINAPINQERVPIFDGKETANNLENAMDLEFLGSIAWNSTIVFVSVPDTTENIYSGFEAAINGVTVDGVFYQPTIISASITTPEYFVSKYEMFRLNKLFEIATKKGIVVCVATGDAGASELYTDNNMPNVNFPASSPFVLACGGTTILPDLTEVAWSWDGKAGANSGASDFFEMPNYQIGIANFPKTNPRLEFLENKRVIPDVSLNADSEKSAYTVYMAGKLYFNRLAGTSAVAPIMAGYLGIVNLPYKRHFNEILYEIYREEGSRCFKDITTGSNDNLPNIEGAWTAGIGFDYLTGMGSIHGKNLYEALKRKVE